MHACVYRVHAATHRAQWTDGHSYNRLTTQAVTAPAHALSAVALAAYKKLLLTLTLLSKAADAPDTPAPSDEQDTAGTGPCCHACDQHSPPFPPPST